MLSAEGNQVKTARVKARAVSMASGTAESSNESHPDQSHYSVALHMQHAG